MKSIFSIFLVGATVGIVHLCATLAFSQAILKERVWTNKDGKKIRAELLRFDDSLKDLVKLRLRGGNIFKIKPESLVRKDQAVILKARFDQAFRHRYSETLGAHFFHSNQIGKEEKEKTVAYIGNDHESAWMRLKVHAPSTLVEKGVRLLFMGEGSGPIRIEYGSADATRRRSTSEIEVSLTKYGKGLKNIFSNPQKVKLYIETESGRFSEVKLSNQEKLGVKEITSAFQTLSALTTDHVWWTIFQGLDPDEFLKKKQEVSDQKPVVEKVAKSGPILPLREWNNDANGDVFMAELTGFDRHMAVFAIDGGKPRSVPVADIEHSGREALISVRMDQSLYQSWHPYDDEVRWFWSTKWDSPVDRIEKQTILFALNRETGNPELYLQLRLETETGQSIKSAKLMSPKVYLDVELPFEGRSMGLRGTESTKVWYQLGDELSELLLVASPGMESLEYEIVPNAGSIQTGKFSEDEFKASIEAVEVFRIWRTLNEE